MDVNAAHHVQPIFGDLPAWTKPVIAQEYRDQRDRLTEAFKHAGPFSTLGCFHKQYIWMQKWLDAAPLLQPQPDWERATLDAYQLAARDRQERLIPLEGTPIPTTPEWDRWEHDHYNAVSRRDAERYGYTPPPEVQWLDP